MNLYRVFGNGLPILFVRAESAEDALHIGRRKINNNYTTVQRIDETVEKVYNLNIEEEYILE